MADISRLNTAINWHNLMLTIQEDVHIEEDDPGCTVLMTF